MKITITASCCAFLFAGALSAQPQWLNQFAFNVGGGISLPESTSKPNLSPAWNAQGGFGYNFTPHLAIMAEIEYDQFRLSSKALDSLGTPQGYPGGHLRTESITIDPVWHLFPKPQRYWDFYVTGGGGAYARGQSLSRPTVATATGQNPYFGYNNPGYPASDFNLNYVIHKPGLDAGVGYTFTIAYNVKLYFEVRYNHIFAGSLGHVDYVPVAIGARW